MALRFAVFGARHWHVLEIARAAEADEAFELVGVAEPDESARTMAAAELGVRAAAEYRELLKGGEVEAVAVAAVNSERADIICAALAAGVHVLADKPMVVSLAQLGAVERAVESSDAILSCALTLRFTSLFVDAREAVARGDIGRVVGSYAQGPHKLGLDRRPDWMFDRERYGGALLDLAVHDIDVARWMHGAEPEMVIADEGTSRFAELGFADHASVYMRMTDGSVALCRSSWLTPDADRTHGDRRLLLEGTDGQIEIVDAGERHLTINRGGTSTTHREPREDPIGQPGAMAGLVRDFAHGITGNAPQLMNAHEAIESHRWSLAAREQAESQEMD